METSCFTFLFVSYKKLNHLYLDSLQHLPPPPSTHAYTNTQHKSAVKTLGIVYGIAES